MRKAIIITLVIVILAAIAIGVYFGFKKAPGAIIGGGVEEKNLPVGGGVGGGTLTGTTSATSTEQAASQTNEEAQYFQKQREKLSIFSIQPVVDYLLVAGVVTKATSTPAVQYYLNQKRELIQIQDVNKEQVVSTAGNFGIPIYLKQNLDGSKAIVYFDTGKFVIFDSKTKVWTELDNGISDVTFSPSGKSIAFLKPSGTDTSLYTRDITSSKKTLTLVATLAIQDFNLIWPDANKIFLASKPSNKYNSEIWYFDLQQKTINKFDSGIGFSALFSYPYDYGIKFISQDRSTMSVSIINKSGKKLADLPFFTLPDKCAFAYDGKLAYCAIPASFNRENFVLPDDYLKKNLYSKDAIYKIDMSSSEINKVVDSETALFDATDLKISGNSLYFINRYNNQLYRFNLE